MQYDLVEFFKIDIMMFGLFSLRASLDKKQRDPEFFLQGIRHIGRLFDFDASDPYDYVEFGHILEEVDKKFNIDTRIREVSVFF